MPHPHKILLPVLLAVAAPAFDLRVTLLQTTDLHDHAKGAGHVAGEPSALGGCARIAAYVEQVRAGCGHPVLLVDSGGWSMGTLYDLTLDRAPLPLWFADALRTPIVASNLEPNGDADLAPFLGGTIRPAVVTTLANGLKVGFIGLMGREAARDAAAAAYPQERVGALAAMAGALRRQP